MWHSSFKGARPCLLALAFAGSLLGSALCADRSMMQQYAATPYDSLAVCNDNSPYNYYYRPGVGSGTNTWVFYFDGGHWCTDQNTCNVRYSSNPSLMSSKSQPKTLTHNYGITSPNAQSNPYWWGANHVFMTYCTSDVYRGDTSTSSWQFRGKRAVAATIKSLLATQTLKSATDILLVGSSAGGPGITGNAGDIYQLLLAAGVKLNRFKLFSDGGWFVDLPQYNGGTGPTYQSDSKALMSYAKVTYDSQCQLNFPGNEWKCFMPQYNWPFLPAPLINHEYLYDTGNLAEDNAQPANYESFRQAITNSFGVANPVGAVNLTQQANASALSVLSSRATAIAANRPQPYTTVTLPGGAGGPVGYKPTILNALAAPLSIFAEACLLHTTVDSPQFTSSVVNDINFNDALWLWFNYDQFLVQEIDSYKGQRSSADCSTAPTTIALAG